MKRVVGAAVGTICLLGSMAACSSDDGGSEDPTPVGGINGPARVVDPGAGGAEITEDD